MHPPPSLSLHWGAFAPLVGARHTVPRAELYAIVIVLRNCVHDACLDIASDSKLNVDLYLKGKQSCMASSSPDLWSDAFSLIESKRITLTLRWVKGHCDTVELASRYSMCVRDITGNLHADSLADRAASMYEPVAQDVVDVLWYYALVRKIQSRAIAILADVIPKRLSMIAPKRAITPRPPSTPLGVAVLGSQHRFTFFGPSARCYICHESAPRLKSHLIDWLKSPCKVDILFANAHFQGSFKPAKLPTHRPTVIGRRAVHESHSLFVLQGLVFCNRCGYYACGRIIKLYDLCTGMDSDRARRRVLNLRMGKLPSGVEAWPNEPLRRQLSLCD